MVVLRSLLISQVYEVVKGDFEESALVDLFGPKNPHVDSGEPLRLPTNKVADFLTYYHKYFDQSNKHLVESVKRAEVALKARSNPSLGRAASSRVREVEKADRHAE